MKKKIVVVTNLPFWPPNNGGKACVYYRLEALLEFFEIAVIRASGAPKDNGSGPVGNSFAWEVLIPPITKNYRWHCRFFLIERAIPLLGRLRQFFSLQGRNLNRTLDVALQEYNPDYILFDPGTSIEMFPSASPLWRWPKVCVEYNVEDEYVRSGKGHSPSNFNRWLTDVVLKMYENQIKNRHVRFLNESRECIFISSRDAGLMKPLLPNTAVTSLPVTVKRPELRKANYSNTFRVALMGQGTPGAVMTGAWWFVKNVMSRPEIKKIGITLLLQPEMAKVISENVPDLPLEIIADEKPSDIDRELIKCDLMVIPLFNGSGIKFKTIFALSLGIPIVATEKAVEGINVANGSEYLYAETEEMFEKHIIELIKDETLRRRIGEAAVKFYEEQHSPEVVGPMWVEKLSNIVRNQ